MKYSEAIKEMKKLKEEGFNPKLLFKKATKDWFVSYLWIPQMAKHYVRIINPQLN